MAHWSAEVAVIGGGPAGLTVAIALAQAGVETLLVSKRPRSDNRTTALLVSSTTALDAVGVWQYCRDQAEPLRAIRLIDDTGRLLRAPEMKFEASEIGHDAFGHNIENRHLLEGLDTRAAALPSLKRIDAEASAIELTNDEARVVLANGDVVFARLLAGADGRNSLCRAAAGIARNSRRYPQAALTFTLTHNRPHHGISTEFHTPTGPFTLVPLSGRRSSLVYVTAPDSAQSIQSLDDADLSLLLERRAHSLLGSMAIEPGRNLFPLTVETAARFAYNRVALIGEAAHVLPPIGAQGLNLGLRDAAALAELIVNARRGGEDIGAEPLLLRYEASRHADVTSRAFAVDLLNRTLLSEFLPFQGARQLSFFLLRQIGPLRRALMREGVAPAGLLPRLMRGETL